MNKKEPHKVQLVDNKVSRKRLRSERKATGHMIDVK